MLRLRGLPANRNISGFLYGVRPFDPPTQAMVALLGGIALAACYIPALGATSVGPAVASPRVIYPAKRLG
ncbi:MAG: hypothetical protein ABSG65_08185 [Bryobacteraceae bacterium]|jgi:hypothetical protein